MRCRRNIAAIAAVCMVALVAVFTVQEHDAAGLAANIKCTPAAIKQLPARVVNTVNAAQRKVQLSGSDVMGRTIMTRSLGNGWQDQAVIIFKPEYCGFVGNINGVPTTDATGSDSPVEHPPDTVDILRNGRLYHESDDEVCISNTPPTARMVTSGAKWHIEMMISCDRAYPSSTWVQDQPNLRAG